MNWISQTTRLAIYLRDNLACVYCGAALEQGAALSLDHVKPWSKGGSNAPNNLVTACKFCNTSRGPRALMTWGGADVVRRARNARRRRLPRQAARQIIRARGSLRRALDDLAA